MRLFQNSGIYPQYLPRLRKLTSGSQSFGTQKSAFLADRYGASHFLLPVYENDPDTFFTNGDDVHLQRAWALENGLKAETPLSEILLAQLEDHRTEIFYNMDPMRVGPEVMEHLPGTVRRKIAWRAAPGNKYLDYYDLVVSNFPSIRSQMEKSGIRTAELYPAHDPELDPLANAPAEARDVDILFIGTYSRHHQQRKIFLDIMASLAPEYTVHFHLTPSRFTRIAETPLGWIGALRKVRRTTSIRDVSYPPVFGREMYTVLGRAKIVLNMAIDMAGKDRGNMRCFEAMGAGATMLTDTGNYPPGMEDGISMLTYSTPKNAVRLATEVLHSGKWQEICPRANLAMRTHYSRECQWRQFLGLLE